MGVALKYYTIDKGLAGAAPDVPPAYVGIVVRVGRDLPVLVRPASPGDLGGIRNFTDRKPVVQISEVVVENSANG